MLSVILYCGSPMPSAVGGNDLPTNASGNNLLHIANASYILMRDMTITGPSGRTDMNNTIQEVIKVNQGDHVYLESSSENFNGSARSGADHPGAF